MRQGLLQELREMLGVPSGKYRDWTGLRRFTLEAAKAEIDHLAPFVLTWQEFRRGRAVERVEIQFTPKDDAARVEAEAEIRRSRVGRKARRAGAVEKVAGIAPKVAAELAQMRKG
jgi:plasmid replication initiation protein